ncbi:hypothetical protein GGI25_003973 [Coemansia spiralis]|uniref:Uncharacterized protein n=2 Tax=Coemansia TaxID=4863 RepID=A0A9W8G167_9FUNG|nr:hypothetical protein EDC05_003859 [Coemansia umbellata]KAJ2620891.1 hypothetical protein GGI26_004590 [Coemansia sp. RSA 1358]KAJ2675465.1 hypothetical protein GGI25_003973 [Coemansia spiralis]
MVSPLPNNSNPSRENDQGASSSLFEEPPPVYSLLPRSDETYIDAGAGAPIVRTQPSHIVVNPSDPRSQYTQQFYNNEHPPPIPPRRTDVTSGPMPVNPRLPPRLNVGYEQIETAPYLTPRTYGSLPHMQYGQSATINVSVPQVPSWQHRESNPLYQPIASSPTASNDAVSSGPMSLGNASYSTINDNLPSNRIANRAHIWHDNSTYPQGQVNRYQQPYTAYHDGSAANSSGSRPHGSSLFGFLDDLLNPESRLYTSQPHSSYRNYHSARPSNNRFNFLP